MLDLWSFIYSERLGKDMTYKRSFKSLVYKLGSLKSRKSGTQTYHVQNIGLVRVPVFTFFWVACVSHACMMRSAHGCRNPCVWIYGGDAFMEVTQAGARIYPKTKTAQHGRRSYLLCIVIPLGSRIAGSHPRYLTKLRCLRQAANRLHSRIARGQSAYVAKLRYRSPAANSYIACA